jgi:hypothetical protein
VVERVNGVTGGDYCVLGVADFGGGGAAVRVCAVLALQPGVEVQPVHLSLLEGSAARGGRGFQGGAYLRGWAEGNVDGRRERGEV